MDFLDNVTISFFSGIILMAILHGVLLASIFLFHNRLNTKSNKFLALSILVICVILTYELSFWLDLDEKMPIWIDYLPIYIRTAIPVGIFYFVIFLIEPKQQLSTFEKLGFVAIGIEIGLHFISISTSFFIENSQTSETTEEFFDMILWFFSIICCLAFIPLALQKVNRYQAYLYNNYSTTNRKSLQWLRAFLILFLIVICPIIISFFQYLFGLYDAGDFTFGIVTICFVILLFWISYFVIIHHSWFEIVSIKNENSEKLATQNKLSSNTVNYYNQLLKLMSEEKMYEDINLTLDRLSEQLQISSGYLSQIIKENEQKNFFEFINFYRVEAVKKKLLNEEYKNYSIMGIALETGFNSKSTFNAVFKKFTNQTPTAFKKQQISS